MGPATQWIRNEGAEIAVDAWGPGAEWVIERAPVLVGGGEDPRSFPDVHPGISELHRRFAAVQIPCTQNIWEAMFPTVLEQKVTGLEARRSFAALLGVFGESAPVGANAPELVLPPEPSRVAGSPAHVFHQAGVEAKRGDTLRRAASYARRLQEAAELPLAQAKERLSKLPGIGVWTIEEIATVALGDSDAVSVGDYHLKNVVSWALAGEARGTDERMVELLEPFRPYRARVLRYLALAGISAPKFGPRMTIQEKW